MYELLQELNLHTVCEEANCPNLGTCFSQKTATFLLLGSVCTRSCRFCNIKKGLPSPIDADEPFRIAAAVKQLQLRHVVLTSVTRDDLTNGGAGHFSATVKVIQESVPGITIEVLIPDFGGSEEALDSLLATTPDIIGHNLETVPRLYPLIRPKADFTRSLLLLRWVKEKRPEIKTKSGLMLGMGERHEEVIWVMQELRRVDCDFLTLGQYLSPSPQHYPIVRFITPSEFAHYAALAKALGFKAVASGPLIRSSFNAVSMIEEVR
jgi:lipoic acid synthetase